MILVNWRPTAEMMKRNLMQCFQSVTTNRNCSLEVCPQAPARDHQGDVSPDGKNAASPATTPPSLSSAFPGRMITKQVGSALMVQ